MRYFALGDVAFWTEADQETWGHRGPSLTTIKRFFQVAVVDSNQESVKMFIRIRTANLVNTFQANMKLPYKDFASANIVSS